MSTRSRSKNGAPHFTLSSITFTNEHTINTNNPGSNPMSTNATVFDLEGRTHQQPDPDHQRTIFHNPKQISSMNTTTFHNTTNEDPAQVDLFSEISKSQDQQVLEMARHLDAFTPWKIWDMMPKTILITSVRRAIKTLVDDGKIEKSGKVEGKFGRPEFQYKIKSA